MTSSNDIDFSELSEKKTIIFVIQSDHDRAMDGLVNLFFSQAIDGFIKSADTYPNQRLPIPVRFFLDDYGATTVIDNLDAMISTIRSRGISVVLILQSEAQLLKAGYGENKTIISNCDTYIYTGGNDIETARAVSTRCNKPLQQVLYMPVGYCWVFTRGSKPVFTQLADRQEVPERYEMISVPATKKPEMKPYASEDPLEEFMELLEFADIT
jgi:type IV secretion system protein VirD4